MINESNADVADQIVVIAYSNDVLCPCKTKNDSFLCPRLYSKSSEIIICVKYIVIINYFPTLKVTTLKRQKNERQKRDKKKKILFNIKQKSNLKPTQHKFHQPFVDKKMLPLYLLTSAKNQPILVELKTGETYNGNLTNCDSWMNLTLHNVIQTNSTGDEFLQLPEIYIKGMHIKYLRIPDETMDRVKEQQQLYHQQQQQQLNYHNRSHSHGGHYGGGDNRGRFVKRRGGGGGGDGRDNRDFNREGGRNNNNSGNNGSGSGSRGNRDGGRNRGQQGGNRPNSNRRN